jgi:hypothetical protein
MAYVAVGPACLICHNERLMMRLDAYYYGFNSTGNAEVDKLLSAVACAGKAFHGTEDWQEKCEPYEDFLRGANPVDWIQNAANDLAKHIESVSVPKTSTITNDKEVI